MSAHYATIERSELQRRILSEITDAVFVTDNEQHVLYWNGPAERMLHTPAESVLGRALGECCPVLQSALAVHPLITETLAETGRWRGDILLRDWGGQEIWLEATASVLSEKRAVAGVLWILRDVTDRKRLEIELHHCKDLLHLRETPPETAPDPEELGSPYQTVSFNDCPARPIKDVVLWAEDNDDDAVFMSRAWEKVHPAEHLIRVRDGAEAIQYLKGEGIYADRVNYPLPRLLLLDIKMPQASGMDVIYWLQQQPAFQDLPVVILTSSAAPSDIHEAARFHVKGYLVKPMDVSEWILKVQTVTAQCK